MVPIAALRRLLRRLDDIQELRTNPLAAPYFANLEKTADSHALSERTAAARVRAAVASAIDGLETPRGSGKGRGARQRAILWRCDLRNEKHEIVARDLGISRREFYRERRRALERLTAALEAEFSRPVEPARLRPSELELRMQYAASLHLVGRFDAALSELDASIQGAAPEERIRGLCSGAEIACDAGKPERAGAMLRAASEALAGAESESATVAQARIDLASGLLTWHTGKIDAALAHYDAALLALHRELPKNEQVTLEWTITALLRKADAYSESGKPDEALVALGEASLLFERLKHAAPLLGGDIASAYAATHAVMTGGLSLAIDEFQEAFTIYQRHHAIRRAAKTSNELAVLFMQREHYDESLRYGRTALSVAQSVCGTDEIAYICLNLSYAEALSGTPKRALALTRQARTLVTRGGFVAALCTLADAEARLAANQCDAAIRSARTAGEAMEKIGAQRYVGAALRIEADAQHRLGNAAGASKQIAEALSLLERFGHAFSLIQAYRCSARVTGNRKHARAAEELLTALQA